MYHHLISKQADGLVDAKEFTKKGHGRAGTGAMFDSRRSHRRRHQDHMPYFACVFFPISTRLVNDDEHGARRTIECDRADD